VRQAWSAAVSQGEVGCRQVGAADGVGGLGVEGVPGATVTRVPRDEGACLVGWGDDSRKERSATGGRKRAIETGREVRERRDMARSRVDRNGRRDVRGRIPANGEKRARFLILRLFRCELLAGRRAPSRREQGHADDRKSGEECVNQTYAW
jgi:hypothetical protein